MAKGSIESLSAPSLPELSDDVSSSSSGADGMPLGQQLLQKLVYIFAGTGSSEHTS